MPSEDLKHAILSKIPEDGSTMGNGKLQSVLREAKLWQAAEERASYRDAVLEGRTSNGRMEWMTDAGQTLKALQERDAGETD